MTWILSPQELGYLVKWEGHPESENSWLTKSEILYVLTSSFHLGFNGLSLFRNADELISKYLDETQARGQAEGSKEVPSKPLESNVLYSERDARKQGQFVEFDGELGTDLELLPSSPVAGGKGKAVALIKRKGPGPVQKGRNAGQGFAAMDMYMKLDSWGFLIKKIDTIEKEGENLFVYGSL